MRSIADVVISSNSSSCSASAILRNARLCRLRLFLTEEKVIDERRASTGLFAVLVRVSKFYAMGVTEERNLRVIGSRKWAQWRQYGVPTKINCS